MTIVKRWAPLLVWALGTLGISLLPLALGRARTPDPMAIHWGPDGSPDGMLALAAVPLIVVGLTAVGLFTTSLFRAEAGPTPEAFAMVGLIGGLGTALMALLVYLNWDAASWDQARSFGFWHVGVVLLGAFVGGLAGLTLGRRLYPERDAPTTEDDELIEIAPGERVSWVGRASVRWPLLLLGLAVVVFVAMPDWGAILGGVFLLLGLAFMQVEANVNNDGLTVRLGGIPVRRITLKRISSARAIDLEPAAWGGWGWRASSKGSAIVLRRGEALELTLGGGRRFAVTVDDASTGAALINGLVARAVGEG